MAEHAELQRRGTDELGLTHGAVSRQIKALEDHLGVTLFRRLSRRVELTEAGTALLPTVRQALRQLETSGVAGLGADKAGPAGGAPASPPS